MVEHRPFELQNCEELSGNVCQGLRCWIRTNTHWYVWGVFSSNTQYIYMQLDQQEKSSSFAVIVLYLVFSVGLDSLCVCVCVCS